MSDARQSGHPLKEAKVQIRLRHAQKEAIAQAARIKQTTLSGFIVEHALNAAQQVLADRVHFDLSPERWEAFLAALDRPPRDIPALGELLTGKGVLDAD